jgi:type III secretory pathway component EscV
MLASAIAFFIAFIIQFAFFLIRKIKEIKSKDNSELDDIDRMQKRAALSGKEGEVAAAIALALRMYMDEQHDFEKTALTIKKTIKPYSPWSSKIYGVRQFTKNREA